MEIAEGKVLLSSRPKIEGLLIRDGVNHTALHYKHGVISNIDYDDNGGLYIHAKVDGCVKVRGLSGIPQADLICSFLRMGILKESPICEN